MVNSTAAPTPMPEPSAVYAGDVSASTVYAGATQVQALQNQHQLWSARFVESLAQLAQWFEATQLANPTLYAEINRLRYQLSNQKIMIALVAEFSRGKSELINALFFAHYGRRILPAGAGRTTMCPTEIAWNPALPPSIRLLPISTRKQEGTLAHWRVRPQDWVTWTFNPGDPESMAEVMKKVSEVQRVSVNEAIALGFWVPQGGFDNPVPDASGQVEVPVWRHACINIPHPLLEQGLVILDTPGLNAVGVEPELTIALLGQAQAIFFVAAADTGVTQSDLALWREYLSRVVAPQLPRYVVLNKLDTLWDELKSDAEIEAEIEKQRQDTAARLGIDAAVVMAVSAQKGLIAKIRQDPVLLGRSRLSELEGVLGGHLVRQRQNIIQHNCLEGMRRLQQMALKALERRFEEVSQQKQQLLTLEAGNNHTLQAMIDRLAFEREQVAKAEGQLDYLQEACQAGIYEVQARLAMPRLRQQVEAMAQIFEGKLLKTGLRRHYKEAFAFYQEQLKACQADLVYLHSSLVANAQNINTEHGMPVVLLPAPSMNPFLDKLALVQKAHEQRMDMGKSWRLMQKEHWQRLLQNLFAQVSEVFTYANVQIEQWVMSIDNIVSIEIAERKRSLEQRTAAISDLQNATRDAKTQIAALDAQLVQLEQSGQQLMAWIKTRAFA